MKNLNPFSNGKWHKNVQTVGELITELQRLPPEIPIRQDMGEGCDVVIFNRDSEPELGFTESGDWDADYKVETFEQN